MCTVHTFDLKEQVDISNVEKSLEYVGLVSSSLDQGPKARDD